MRVRALTICEPYASLICLPDTDQRHKRVENRNWETKYRGTLAIHAGYAKCGHPLMRPRWTSGVATDIRLRTRACSKWEPAK